MKTFDTEREEDGHDVLTEKQRRVLDLLIENKTSKEIGRALGISPYTVDQRISLARGKLGVSSRTELAAHYRLMRKTATSSSGMSVEPQQEPSEEVYEHPVPDRERPLTDGDPAPPSKLAPEGNFFPTDAKIDHRVGPEVFEGMSGTLWRMGAIIVTALLLVMTILGLFAIFAQLNDLLA